MLGKLCFQPRCEVLEPFREPLLDHASEDPFKLGPQRALPGGAVFLGLVPWRHSHLFARGPSVLVSVGHRSRECRPNGIAERRPHAQRASVKRCDDGMFLRPLPRCVNLSGRDHLAFLNGNAMFRFRVFRAQRAWFDA